MSTEPNNQMFNNILGIERLAGKLLIRKGLKSNIFLLNFFRIYRVCNILASNLQWKDSLKHEAILNLRKEQKNYYIF